MLCVWVFERACILAQTTHMVFESDGTLKIQDQPSLSATLPNHSPHFQPRAHPKRTRCIPPHPQPTAFGPSVAPLSLNRQFLETSFVLPQPKTLHRRQALYFDRYTRLLAPDLDPLRDDRVTLPNGDGRADAGVSRR